MTQRPHPDRPPPTLIEHALDQELGACPELPSAERFLAAVGRRRRQRRIRAIAFSVPLLAGLVVLTMTARPWKTGPVPIVVRDAPGTWPSDDLDRLFAGAGGGLVAPGVLRAGTSPDSAMARELLFF